MSGSTKPIIAVSSCLVGEEVRFDRGHKRSVYLTNFLADHVEFRQFCPEVGIGLPIPRESIRLERDGERINAISRSGVDHTNALREYGERTAQKLGDISGYVFKKDSPSCGVFRVKVYEIKDRPPERNGRGIYADAIIEALPDLPVEEEGRLQDPRLKENFIERVFVYWRWQNSVALTPSPDALVKFHTMHKFALMAHDETNYREAGRIVAKAGKGDINETCAEYIAHIMQGFRKLTSPSKHANVLQHIMGFFKSDLAADDKAALLEQIEEHRLGRVPLIVPITLINYFRKKHGNDYIDDQYYLSPYPAELMLRNSL